jgi:hypothetical protein
MNNQGLIENVSIEHIDKNEELAFKIMKARKWKEDKLPFIHECLQYNVLTPKQFCYLAGKAASTVTNLIQPKFSKGELQTGLDHCYPFKNLKTPGPLFIVRNEKCESYLIKKNK